jgi:hypothetical protein
VKFFFPDSHDLVDPSFDFQTEERSATRVRQQHDLYAHQLFAKPPYDGLLLSKAIVDGSGNGAGKYTAPQRHRLFRTGLKDFFRLEGTELQTMGDCGAFAYVREKEPPYSVDDVIDFYEKCGFDLGVSVDHIVLGYAAKNDESIIDAETLGDFRERRQITLNLAAEFIKKQKRGRLGFVPVGAAQGWSAKSYADSVVQLQKMGYTRIGLGGLVPLKTPEIIEVLDAVGVKRRKTTSLHLFGVTRLESLEAFQTVGVTSFDSTSPLLHAFKHDSKNYFTASKQYAAIRVPQVEGNAKLAGRIRAGEVSQEQAIRLEQDCLKRLNKFQTSPNGLRPLLKVLHEYNSLFDGRKDRTAMYARTLEERPWQKCRCAICKRLGIHIVIFRGAERNRRRGFHNLYVTHAKMQRKLRAIA